MNIHLKNKIYILVFIYIIFNFCSFANTYIIPSKNSFLIGKNVNIIIPKNNKLPLEWFAKRYQVGLSNLMEANPEIDVYLPKSESFLLIPGQLLLPRAPRKGIIINSAEMRLYYYLPNQNKVVIFPIGIGEINHKTPENWITKIYRKKFAPTWIPTKKMHKEYENLGKKLPTIFLPGKDNPMGKHALYLGKLYAIHGTNADFGIGLRISHGCIRLRENDIKWLFDNVPIGTRVQFINQPIKASIEPNGSRYLEIHKPLSKNYEEFFSEKSLPIKISKNIYKILSDNSVNQKRIYIALKNKNGIPIKINNI